MKPFQRLLIAAPAAALLPAVMAPASSLANEVQLNLDSVQGYSIAQATTIRDFSDVYPTDWAYQALADLVETYGCVSGFGDGTFRGQQPLSRFEMAAILSSCLDAVSAKMDAMGDDMKMSAMEDMDTLNSLVASFEEELITLKGAVDGLDAKVSELEDSQFSTTTKASFEIATDFAYFASDDAAAKATGVTEDNSGVGMSSEIEVSFETSFTGSDSLTFSMAGDLLTAGSEYLSSSDFYDLAGDEGASASFSGFAYETSLDLGGMATTLTFGTDVDDLDPIVGLDTYYGGGGYDGYGAGDFGDAGIGFSVELLSSAAGTVTGSASYAIADGNAANQTGDYGIFGEKTDRSGVLALSWEGALFGGNDALFTVAYQDIKLNDATLDSGAISDVEDSLFHLVAGSYLTDTISLSGSYSFSKEDYSNAADVDTEQWMIALNMEDAIFPGNSAGIAYGTPKFDEDADDVMKVLELYYTFSINDNFQVPVYLDFISNVGAADSDAFAIAVRPTLSF